MSAVSSGRQHDGCIPAILTRPQFPPLVILRKSLHERCCLVHPRASTERCTATPVLDAGEGAGGGVVCELDEHVRLRAQRDAPFAWEKIVLLYSTYVPGSLFLFVIKNQTSVERCPNLSKYTVKKQNGEPVSSSERRW